MLSRLCNPLFHQHKIALNGPSYVRYFVQTTVKSARIGGFRTNYSEQLASFKFKNVSSVGEISFFKKIRGSMFLKRVFFYFFLKNFLTEKSILFFST